MKIKIWKSKIYRSRYSKRIEGELEIEGENRAAALAMLGRLVVAPGAAGTHARDVLAGQKRHALTVSRRRGAYAAQDGCWRGWGEDAWRESPPAAYARWDV